MASLSSIGGPRPPASRSRTNLGGSSIQTSSTSRASRLSVSSSQRLGLRRNNAQAAANKKFELLDANGVNVAPRSLLTPSKDDSRPRASQAVVDASLTFDRDLPWGSSKTGASINGEVQQASTLLTASLPTFSAIPVSALTSMRSEASAARSFGDVDDDEEEDPLPASLKWTTHFASGDQLSSLSDAELNKQVHISLEETETMWLLDLTPSWVPDGSEEAENVKRENKTYQELKTRKENAPDAFTARAAQTNVRPLKDKDAQTTRIGMVSTSVQASSSEMHDTYVRLEELASNLDISAEDGSLRRLAARVMGEIHEAAHSSSEILVYEDPLKSNPKKRQEAGAGVPESLSALATNKADVIAATKDVDEETRTALWQSASSSSALKVALKRVEFLLLHRDYAREQALYQNREVLTEPQPASAASATVESTTTDAATDSTDAGSVSEQMSTVGEEEASGDPTPQTSAAAIKAEKSTDTLSATASTNSLAAEKAALPRASTSVGPTASVPQGRLQQLWTYKCPAVAGMRVTSLAWNKTNPDILAVGYCSTQDVRLRTSTGVICCWSIKNPQHPQRIRHTSSGVTALDFSEEHPNLLAVGMTSGLIAIYDVQSERRDPLVDTSLCDAQSKHTLGVWQLRFVRLLGKGGADDRTEVLVSASADGRILQWNMEKSLESSLLMNVKRIGAENAAKAGEARSALIARRTGVMAMDFSPQNSALYSIGTEDGTVHQCSCSYSDSFLTTTKAHSGPVYQLALSPFDSDVMLSCSSDWRLCLWHAKSGPGAAPFVLQPGTSAVMDAAWSKQHPTVLASISESAVDLWNLCERQQDPVFSLQLGDSQTQLTRVVFNPKKPVLAVADSSGRVRMYLVSTPSEDATAAKNVLTNLAQGRSVLAASA